MLIVKDNEHRVADTMGGNEVTCQKLLSLEKCMRENPGSIDPVGWLYFSRGGGITNTIILIYNCVIWILLIKTNSIIYNFNISHRGGVGICVLAVKDNKLNNEVTVAKGRTGVERMGLGNNVITRLLKGWKSQRICWIQLAPETPDEKQALVTIWACLATWLYSIWQSDAKKGLTIL